MRSLSRFLSLSMTTHHSALSFNGIFCFRSLARVWCIDTAAPGWAASWPNLGELLDCRSPKHLDLGDGGNEADMNFDFEQMTV